MPGPLSGDGQPPRKVAEDGLEFVNAALALIPTASAYWNTKGLLLADGLGRDYEALVCLRMALELEPDSIQVRQNIRDVEKQARDARQQKWFGVAMIVGFLALATLVAITGR